MKIIFILIVLCVTNLVGQTNCEGQQVIFDAEQLYRSKENYPQALALYQAAFQQKQVNVSKTLDAISCATFVKDTQAVRSFLAQGMSIGLQASSIENLWERLGNGMDLGDLFDQINTASIRQQYLEKLDVVVIQELSLLAKRDQELRSLDDYDWDEQKKLDQLNWKRLQKMVESRNRFLTYTEIGFDGSEDLELLFYHMDKDILEWFLPYVIPCIQAGESTLGEVILYQLDRVGMSEGLIYTVSSDHKIVEHADRTKMKNGYWCQVYGEWFAEKSRQDKQLYETPYDPNISIEKINEIRAMFCLDSVDSRRKRRPWINSVSIEDFERLIAE